MYHQQKKIQLSIKVMQTIQLPDGNRLQKKKQYLKQRAIFYNNQMSNPSGRLKTVIDMCTHDNKKVK